MREDTRSPIWGGATLGLVVGLILGFFVGTYWMTVLYAVLIGAASGIAANVLAWLALLGSSLQRRRRRKRYELSAASDELSLDEISAGLVEETLQEHSPADFETSRNAAIMCVNGVRDLEEREWWRFGYDSLDSFYEAHENQHPDIRLYAALGRDFPIPDSLELPDGIGEDIARRIALRRPSTGIGS